MITIRHTHEDGTLIEGTVKGDGVYEIAKQPAYGFRFFPSIKMIGIRGSRDRIAQRSRISGLAEALRAAGYEVAVEIDDTPRDRAIVLADQDERLDDRREALEDKAARRHASAEAHHKEASRIADARNGQPILIGHHSEARGWADQRRIDRNMSKFCEEYGEAKETSRRAAAVGSNAAYSATPGVTARRIEKAQAELRKIQRSLDGHSRTFRDHAGNPYFVEAHEPAQGQYREQLLARKAQLEAQLVYDQAALDGAKADGRFVEYGPHNVHVGDLIQIDRHRWHRVVKVNRKTVSVETGYSWTDKIPFTDIGAVRTPGEAE